MQIDYGPGYRMYFVSRGNTVAILLCGGDKRSQARDITRAVEMAQKFNMALKTTRWDTAETLKTKQDIAAYLDAVLEDGDPDLLKLALGHVARSKGG